MGRTEVETVACICGGSHCQPHMCMSFPCSVAAVRMADGLTFVIYEFWETEEEWKRLVKCCPYPITWGWAGVRWDWLALGSCPERREWGGWRGTWSLVAEVFPSRQASFPGELLPFTQRQQRF